VALIEQLLDGRNELPLIPDVRALRDRFIALDLDPDRGQERERERAEAEAARDVERSTLSDELQTLRRQGLDALIVRAWDVIGDAKSLTLVNDTMRADPKASAIFDALEWIMAADHEDRLSQAAHVDACAWLARHDTRAIQPTL
jgi:hypothetical protein